MSDILEAPVLVELPFQGTAGGTVQVALSDEGVFQIIHAAADGQRTAYPIHRSTHRQAIISARAALDGRPRSPSEEKILAATVLLLDQQLVETMRRRDELQRMLDMSIPPPEAL